MKQNDALKRELSRTPPKEPRQQCDNPNCGCKQAQERDPQYIKGDAKPVIRG